MLSLPVKEDLGLMIMKRYFPFSKTGVSPSDVLVLYPGHSYGGVKPLQRYSQSILQSQPTGLSIYQVFQ